MKKFKDNQGNDQEHFKTGKLNWWNASCYPTTEFHPDALSTSKVMKVQYPDKDFPTSDGDFQNNNDFILIFEKRLAEYTGYKYAVLTDSCTSSIRLALEMEILNDSKYLTGNIKIPKCTYKSVVDAIDASGIHWDFVAQRWKGAYLLENTRIIDSAGFLTSTMGASLDININGLTLSAEDKSVDTYNALVCLSFQAKKPLSLGKGGAILTNSREEYWFLKRLAHDGRDSAKRVQDDKLLKFDGDPIGMHHNMDPLQAAIGCVKLNDYIQDIASGRLKVGIPTSDQHPDLTKIYNSKAMKDSK